MATPEIRIYDALRPTLGELTTKEFIEALDESIVAKIEIMKNDLATKADLAAVRNELKSDIGALKGEIADLRLATKTDIGGLKDDIAKYRYENIKYTFIAGAVQTILIIGALLAIIRASK